MKDCEEQSTTLNPALSMRGCPTCVLVFVSQQGTALLECLVT